MRAEFEEDLKAAICEEAGMDPTELGRADALLTTGVVDSFAFASIVMLVEEEIGTGIDPAELSIENFDSIDAIDAFMTRATQATA